jgi:hypothetical protein
MRSRRAIGGFGVVLMVWTVGCSRAAPTAPMEVGGAASAAQAVDATTAESVVTLMADTTASPSQVTVPNGSTILITNASGRYVLLRSFNCSEFSSMGLQAGASRHTMPFNPGGKTCDFFAYDYPKKIFVGQVHVQ